MRHVDDRPFPDSDREVFPVENMYDRIVMPSKFSQNSILFTSKVINSSPDVCRSSSNKIVEVRKQNIAMVQGKKTSSYNIIGPMVLRINKD